MKLSWLRCVQRFVWPSIIAMLPTAMLPTVAMAQSQAPQQAEPHGSVVQATLVFLCIVLGLVLVNRSANRKSEILIDEIDEE